MAVNEIGVWFPTIRTGTGTEVFTIRLVDALKRRGIRAEITWLPHYAEYFPWGVRAPQAPTWTTVVHVNSWLHSRFVPKGLPVIATVHSATYDRLLLPYKSFLQRLYHKYWIYSRERWYVNNSQVMTAVSHYAAEQVGIHFARKDVVAIHNWIDLNVFGPDEKLNAKKCKSPFLMAFVGTPCARKGIDLLPKIMQELGNDFQLKFTAAMKQVPGYPNIPENMIPIERLCGDQELAEFYRSIDLLLFPSRVEGFGLVALEAMACGVPVVTTNSSALGEVVQNGVAGYLCKQDDVASFVAAIKHLAADKKLREKMGRDGHKLVREKFSEELILQQYIELYASLSQK